MPAAWFTNWKERPIIPVQACRDIEEADREGFWAGYCAESAELYRDSSHPDEDSIAGAYQSAFERGWDQAFYE